MGKKDLYRRWNNYYTEEETVEMTRDEQLTLENYKYFHEDEDNDGDEEDEDEDVDGNDEIENFSRKYGPLSKKKRNNNGESGTAENSNCRNGNGGLVGNENGGVRRKFDPGATIITSSSNNQRHKNGGSLGLGHLTSKLSRTPTHHHHHLHQRNSSCSSGSPGSRFRPWIKNTSIKMQLFGLSFGLLVCGFLTGYIFGSLRRSMLIKSELHSSSSSASIPIPSSNNEQLVHPWSSLHSHFSNSNDDDPFASYSSFPHEINETMFQTIINQISADNIHHNLKRMTQEVHTAGTSEGRSMSMALRDLWRSYGLSVRVEQHKALLTRSTTFNYMEIMDKNGSLLYTTSQSGDDVNLPNAIPIIAFSPAAQLNGTLIYGHYGSFEDFEFLNNSKSEQPGGGGGQQVILNGSILLVKFSNSHPSEIVNLALRYGVSALVFYPDPIDFGPLLPGIAVKRDSLFTMTQIHEHQKHKKKVTLPCHTISFNDAERLLSLMRNERRVMSPMGVFVQQQQQRIAKVEGEEQQAGGEDNRANTRMSKGKGKRMKNKRNPNYLRVGGQGGTSAAGTTIIKTQFNSRRNSGSGNNNAGSGRRRGPEFLQLHNARLHIFNEAKSANIYNVVASIPGTWESDRYVVIGCSHDSWAYGAGDPGIGLALMTEIVRVFTSSVQAGWKPRRSILFISFDANLYASNGLFHWLQEHHFEISTRAITFIDLTRLLQGNQTLYVYSSPLLKELVKKTIEKIQRYENTKSSSASPSSSQLYSKNNNVKKKELLHPFLNSSQTVFTSTLTSNEPSFAFFGNLGIPFIRLSLANSPKSYDYPLFHTAFDTYENFVNLVDSTLNGSETLGRIISGLILLLTDSSLLPMNVEDYVEQIQQAFENFMVYYQEDLHRANLSISYLQAAVMRLQVIGDNFRTDVHNRSVINNELHDLQKQSAAILNHSSIAHKTNKLLFHRIINDKLMELDRAFLSKKSEFYKHQIIGYSTCSWLPLRKMVGEDGGESDGGNLDNNTKSKSSSRKKENAHQSSSGNDNNNCMENRQTFYDNHFPKLRESLNCGRKLRLHEQQQQDHKNSNIMNEDEIEECSDWRALASQEITLLIRCLDAAAATLQSPLLPEESDTNNNN